MMQPGRYSICLIKCLTEYCLENQENKVNMYLQLKEKSLKSLFFMFVNDTIKHFGKTED